MIQHRHRSDCLHSSAGASPSTPPPGTPDPHLTRASARRLPHASPVSCWGASPLGRASGFAGVVDKGSQGLAEAARPMTRREARLPDIKPGRAVSGCRCGNGDGDGDITEAVGCRHGRLCSLRPPSADQSNETAQASTCSLASSHVIAV